MSSPEEFGAQPALLTARGRRRPTSKSCCSALLFRKHILADAEMTSSRDIIQSTPFTQPNDVLGEKYIYSSRVTILQEQDAGYCPMSPMSPHCFIVSQLPIGAENGSINP